MIAPSPPPRRRPILRWFRQARFFGSLLGLLTFLLFLTALPFLIRNIASGEVGVVWQRFGGGTRTDFVLREGIHLLAPWDRLYIYPTRLQDTLRRYDTLSSDGLSMVVEVSVRYRVNIQNAGYLHKHVGPNYPTVLIDASVGAFTRSIISKYTPEQLYRNLREDINNEIAKALLEDYNLKLPEDDGTTRDVNLLYIEDVMVRSIEMPPEIRLAIERKAEQYQLLLEYEYRLKREEAEKQRRQIEAEGLRAYSDTLPNGISPSYLTLRGIEATLELAKSQNSKILLFGSPGSSLPFILNSMMAPLPGAPPTTPTPAAVPPSAVTSDEIGPPAPSLVRQANNKAAQEVENLLNRLSPFPPPIPPASAPGAAVDPAPKSAP